MHDRNDIKFKSSLGSPPKTKWQLFSWGPGTLSFLPTLSLLCSFVSKQRLHCKDIFLLLMGGEGVGPQEMRGQVETLKTPTLPTERDAHLWSPHSLVRGDISGTCAPGLQPHALPRAKAAIFMV